MMDKQLLKLTGKIIFFHITYHRNLGMKKKKCIRNLNKHRYLQSISIFLPHLLLLQWPDTDYLAGVQVDPHLQYIWIKSVKSIFLDDPLYKLRSITKNTKQFSSTFILPRAIPSTNITLTTHLHLSWMHMLIPISSFLSLVVVKQLNRSWWCDWTSNPVTMQHSHLSLWSLGQGEESCRAHPESWLLKINPPHCYPGTEPLHLVGEWDIKYNQIAYPMDKIKYILYISVDSTYVCN